MTSFEKSIEYSVEKAEDLFRNEPELVNFWTHSNPIENQHGIYLDGDMLDEELLKKRKNDILCIMHFAFTYYSKQNKDGSMYLFIDNHEPTRGIRRLYAILPVIPILEKDVGHNITVLYVRHPEIKSFLYKAAWKVALLALPKYLNIVTVNHSVDVGTFQKFIHN